MSSMEEWYSLSEVDEAVCRAAREVATLLYLNHNDSAALDLMAVATLDFLTGDSSDIHAAVENNYEYIGVKIVKGKLVRS